MKTAATPRFVERIWGRRDLRAWYPERGLEPAPVGEAWLTPPAAPVLIKLLFPAARLSVQVHPGDAYAAAHGLGLGKTEMWYVLEAAPGASLGVGLRPGARWEDFGPACRAGRAAEMLRWFTPHVGDLFYVPAGTVHAIGPGVVLCEVQQPSDNTFRLDDYARRDARGELRELHLDRGLAVAAATDGGPVAYGLAPLASGLLLRTAWFSVARLLAGGDVDLAAGRWVVNIGPAIGDLPRGHALWLQAPWRAPHAARLLVVTAFSQSGTL